ncbi:hypothetical protein [Xanthomonas arboricola]|uniref:Cap15 family cyclic dinucleotide receptor domain-containing protein n=1 Tax=Xanthomonas arboricola TaxID=56448 RepID=UPI000CED8F2E|nr:hypothetical protein [Xanthomonas arboricola]PPU21903.1 hypothetical protein XarbCFBP7610_00820 [Xanthomonas arboricola]
MRSVTASFPEIRRLLRIAGYAALGLTAAIATGLVYCGGKEWPDALLKASSWSILLITGAVNFLAEKRWIYPILARLTKRPLVHGLWVGHLTSDYGVRDGKPPLDPIQIFFVIRQSYLHISIESHTKTQQSYSTIEHLEKNEKTDNFHLEYVFEMVRTAHSENKITTGFGKLRLLDKGQAMSGDYWTNSPTQGQLMVNLVTRDCEEVNSFESALAVQRMLV